MVPLDAKWFGNQRDLVIAEALELEAASLGYPVQGVLGKHGWDGTLVVGFGLELTNDNAKCQEGPGHHERAAVKGTSLDPGKQAMGEGRKKTITFQQAAEFDFAAGTMASEYLGGECVKIVCSREDQVILPADWATHGISASCFRVLLYLDKSSNARCGLVWRFIVLFSPTASTS